MGRAPCCDKASVKKGPWSPEEDATLKCYIEEHGPVGNWIALPQKIGLRRCGKSCRLRWLNYLRPNIKHGGFSEEEDNIICSLYISIGSRWSIIAAQLPGRTDNDIKNYWNTKLKKKLLGKQRNKEHRIRRDSLKRESASLSPENESFPLISGSAGDWSEVPGGVNDLSFASINQSPSSLISDQATMRGLLAQLGGGEQEPIPTNTTFLQYLNDLIPPSSYYPYARNMVLGSSQPLGDSVPLAPTALNHEIQDFSMSEIEYRSLQGLLDVPDAIGIYGTYGMANGSMCSSGLSNGEGSNIVWEDISSLLADNGACPPLLCDYEAPQSQTLGGGRGPQDYSLEESRLYVGHC